MHFDIPFKKKIYIMYFLLFVKGRQLIFFFKD